MAANAVTRRAKDGSAASVEDAVPRADLKALTTAALGRPISTMTALLDYVESIEVASPEPSSQSSNENDAVWVGSVGYENYRDVGAFARMLAEADIQRLLDVRELPISRRRGFAKTALSEALAAEGIEYVHLRTMGNPKKFRDLYKTGNVDAGRSGYKDFLLSERQDELRALDPLIREKPTALMCVEHDQDICHREVIFEALRNEVGLELNIAQIG